MTVQVIGAGFARTGTMSMQKALNDLGLGPTYHMNDVFQNPSHAQDWLDYGETDTADWDAMFAKYHAVVDFPASLAWRELYDHYPEAKVVLTVRDRDRWWDSMNAVIYPTRTLFPAWLKRVIPFTQRWTDMVDSLVWTRTFDGKFLDKAYAIQVFDDHVEEVQAYCDPARLLIFEVSQGWQPLCEFLDVPVPATSFPHLNDTASLKRRFAGIRWGTRALPYLVLAALAVAVFLLLR